MRNKETAEMVLLALNKTHMRKIVVYVEQNTREKERETNASSAAVRKILISYKLRFQLGITPPFFTYLHS